MTKDRILDAFARQSGLPELFLRDEKTLQRSDVLDFFQARIIGQDRACEVAADVVTRFKAGMNDPGRPVSVLIFCGPTGVGKTALARALGDYFFGHGDESDPQKHHLAARRCRRRAGECGSGGLTGQHRFDYYATGMNNSRTQAYYKRVLESACLEAAEQFPVILITGPRQVGKTSMLEHLRGSERRYVTLDDMNLRALARSDPPLFLQQFPPPVLIDEVQYAPELFPAIKLAADRASVPGAFWLTGSQSFPLMKGVSESLAGRVAILNLLGFSAREAERRPSVVPPFLPEEDAIRPREDSAAKTTLPVVYERIWRGSYPALVSGKVRDRDLFYRSYVQTYLQRDVRDLLKVGDLDQFMRFLKAAAARTGQLLNYTDIARDCGMSVNTARNWMSVLQASHQVYLLPAWHTNLSKRLYTTPKLHFLDTGLCAYLTEWSSPETLAVGAMSGAILETYVVGEVLKSWWHQGKEPALYHYRDKDRREIDLLISHDGRLYPLEIKKSATFRAEDASAFALLDRHGAKRGTGAIVSLCADKLALTRDVIHFPVGML